MATHSVYPPDLPRSEAAFSTEHPTSIEGEIQQKLNREKVKTEGEGGNNEFIPWEAVERFITQDVVQRWVQGIASGSDYGGEGGFSFIHHKSIAETIMVQGRGLLAALILSNHSRDIHRHFFGRESGPPIFDKNMPLVGPALADFNNKKWDMFLTQNQYLVFGIPTFNRFLSLKDLPFGTRMPFLKETPIGQGGFGEVYKITIHPGYDHFTDDWKASNHVYVRKTLIDYHDEHPGRSTRDLFLNEVGVLKRLARKQHQHMITLLASYMRGAEYTMIFPYASADLEKYLTTKVPVFSMDSASIKQQLFGLADALRTLHFFQYDDHEAGLTFPNFGYHHDLKPGNILIVCAEYGGAPRFVLSDFGTAQSKDTQLFTSDIQWVNLALDYSPPEFRTGVETNKEKLDLSNFDMNQKFDVWSLGAIYLEILVHLSDGADGVKRFRDQRNTKPWDKPSQQSKLGLFHDSKNVKVEVQSCLECLRRSFGQDTSLLSIIGIIEKCMLVVDPERRGTSEGIAKLVQRAIPTIALLADLLSINDMPTEAWMPILKNEHLGEDIFAHIYKITTQAEYDHLPDVHKASNHVYIRKVMNDYRDNRPGRSTRELFSNEVKVLNNLFQNKHKHMNVLIDSYVHGTECNMIFQLPIRDLEDYLIDHFPLPRMDSADIKQQLLGLMDGLRHLHSFKYPDYAGGKMLSIFGYYNGLTPANILVLPNSGDQGYRFVLSDFGTARLNDTLLLYTSKTAQDDPFHDYSPPEFQGSAKDELQDDVEAQWLKCRSKLSDPELNRKFDIWSMGCIFVEILTHLPKGSTNVHKFRKRRTTKDPVYDSRFFDESQNVKAKVRAWLDYLRRLFKPKPPLVEIVNIIEHNMLLSDPHKRKTSEGIVDLIRNVIYMPSAARAVGDKTPYKRPNVFKPGVNPSKADRQKAILEAHKKWGNLPADHVDQLTGAGSSSDPAHQVQVQQALGYHDSLSSPETSDEET